LATGHDHWTLPQIVALYRSQNDLDELVHWHRGASSRSKPAGHNRSRPLRAWSEGRRAVSEEEPATERRRSRLCQAGAASARARSGIPVRSDWPRQVRDVWCRCRDRLT